MERVEGEKKGAGVEVWKKYGTIEKRIDRKEHDEKRKREGKGAKEMNKIWKKRQDESYV